MEKKSDEIKINGLITSEHKQMLSRALDGINGWNFNPIALVTNGQEDYYFICKVKSAIKGLQMKVVKVYIKISKDNKPRLLSIEKIE